MFSVAYMNCGKPNWYNLTFPGIVVGTDSGDAHYVLKLIITQSSHMSHKNTWKYD